MIIISELRRHSVAARSRCLDLMNLLYQNSSCSQIQQMISSFQLQNCFFDFWKGVCIIGVKWNKPQDQVYS